MTREIKVGDKVKVVDWGQRYSEYTDFFEEHEYDFLNKACISLGDIASYGFGRKGSIDNYTFEVLYIGKHHNDIDMIAFIKAVDEYDKVHTFLVGIKGLALDVPKMTYEEIREKLGYDFELVD